MRYEQQRDSTDPMEDVSLLESQKRLTGTSEKLRWRDTCQAVDWEKLRRWKFAFSATLLAILGGSVLISISMLRTQQQQLCTKPLDVSGYLCAPNGAPVSVARARDCEFDWMSYHWLPRSRFDGENRALIDEFSRLGPWYRYADSDGTQLLDQEAVMARTEAFLTRREHLHHCDYAIRQTYMFMARGDDPPFHYEHIVHCTTALLDAIYENLPADIDNLTIHAVPFPKTPQLVSALKNARETYIDGEIDKAVLSM